MSMNFNVNQRPAASILAGCGLLLCAVLLVGCASNPGGRNDAATDIVTEYDATEAQKLARLRIQLGAAYLEQGQTTEALDSLKQALQMEPGNMEAHNLRGLIYMRLNDTQLAEESFRRAVTLSSRNGNVLHNYAWFKCTQGQYPEAAALFNQALNAPAYTAHAKTHMTAGLCHQRSGDLVQAEASLQRAYEMDPGNPVVGYNLALVMFQKRDFQRAEFFINRINRSELANAQTLWLGVKVERRLGNLQGMRDLGARLQQRFPSTDEAQFYERGQFER
jgi:type IV pilus assembly protein PilF